MNFTPPPITQGPWQAIPIEHGIFAERWKDFSHRIQGETFSPCVTFRDGKLNAGTAAANARAISALPLLMRALEKIWGSHCLEDFDPEISTHANYIELHAAMVAAGYIFEP